MPTKIEKDSVTGRETTGHEWDGLKELNTPLPKWWLYVFYACIVFAVGQFLLYPSIPYGTGYFHGLLGYSQRAAVDADVAKIVAQRQVEMDKIGALSFAQIKADPKLLEVALVDGKAVFATNCQPCHGAGGGGNPGYPALAAGAWIWGGTLDAIQKSVTHGIRSGDPAARQMVMPNFGAGVLTPAQIQQVADFVSTTFYGNKADGRDVTDGGNPGYPALAAGAWIWGGTLDAIQKSVTHGIRSGDPAARQMVMPNFGAGVLTPAQIQQVADFVSTTFYGNKADGRDVTDGGKLYAQNCAICHGVNGQGNRTMGAPRLASQVHLYGNTREAIAAQITAPHMGVMPAWNTRLDPATIKAVTLYVHSLGGGE